jgi:hypothetical protein
MPLQRHHPIPLSTLLFILVLILHQPPLLRPVQFLLSHTGGGPLLLLLVPLVMLVVAVAAAAVVVA